MRIGPKESTMGLKTRLDGRSVENASFKILDKDGVTIAEVRLVDTTGITLEITTEEGSYISKPNGWTSKKN